MALRSLYQALPESSRLDQLAASDPLAASIMSECWGQHGGQPVDRGGMDDEAIETMLEGCTDDGPDDLRAARLAFDRLRHAADQTRAACTGIEERAAFLAAGFETIGDWIRETAAAALGREDGPRLGEGIVHGDGGIDPFARISPALVRLAADFFRTPGVLVPEPEGEGWLVDNLLALAELCTAADDRGEVILIGTG